MQTYSTLAQKINADFLCDEENPLLEHHDEESNLSSDVEKDLTEVNLE